PMENRFAFCRAINSLLLYRAIRTEIVRRGSIPHVLLTNSPFFSLPFTWLPSRLRVYDAMDELVRFSWAPPDAASQERLVIAQADLVTAGTLSLARAKAHEYEDLVDRVEYIGCGADARHFSPPGPDAPKPVDIYDLPRPIVGFFGAINERVDPVVLEALARAMPEASIVLIGPVYKGFHQSGHEGQGREDTPDLRKFGNIHFLGPKPYAQLPACLAAFDCAIVPYRLTDGIEFVQPVKVLEYLAGGKPVVSTAIPDVVEIYGHLVRIGRSPRDFVQKAR
ncbi:glycosyltransferase, partial [bacterium]|nr:glycosyltransferase [bacterium]